MNLQVVVEKNGLFSVRVLFGRSLAIVLLQYGAVNGNGRMLFCSSRFAGNSNIL